MIDRDIHLARALLVEGNAMLRNDGLLSMISARQRPTSGYIFLMRPMACEGPGEFVVPEAIGIAPANLTRT